MAYEKQDVNTLKHHLPSMVFIIFLRYDIAYSRCYGLMSVTKLVSCVTILLLVQDE